VGRLPQGADLVVRANPLAAQENSAELAVDLDRLVDRVTTKLLARRP
jgi:ribonuclease P protein component